MENLQFTLQGLNSDANHFETIKNIINMDEATHIILSTAFLNERGVTLLENSLKANSEKITVFAGARNGVTTYQGIKRLLDLNIKVYIIDTGYVNRIHHQKVFIAYNNKRVRFNMGSANLTAGGLLNNIESSVTIETNADNNDISDLIKSFNSLKINYPENVIKISSYTELDSAKEKGQLEDEMIRREIVKGTSKLSNKVTLTPPMNLPTMKINSENKSSKIKSPKQLVTSIPQQSITLKNYSLALHEIWHSKPLSTRDLNIKSENANTNTTGSMLLKKGLSDINQQTYFRHEAFSKLKWTPRVNKPHFEDAEANFHLIIEGIDYGIITLQIKHDTRTNTATYKQNQGMTHLHWGKAKSFISNSKLLEKEMKIYSVDGKNDEFVIKIQDIF